MSQAVWAESDQNEKSGPHRAIVFAHCLASLTVRPDWRTLKTWLTHGAVNKMEEREGLGFVAACGNPTDL
ncbi:unnamed protein product [Bursaphelenchus xylophilus]|uniref:(pine wood nematode) hypothetical protein n=1 Tax=Bursaphelenchus xylophilus TaxID=6326 RepID=A0A1I7S2T7_BURXY|nr:unnamed protein product [Bursaphelenchus xylophilus]CAG9121619.1 unnamed protein product [Bursaphelenchus xylophilus]